MSRVERAVFLDRDGTINVDTGYVYELDKFALAPGAIEGLKVLAALPVLLIITTGQSGIGRGYYSVEQYDAFMEHLFAQLKPHEVSIDASYFCPHHPTKALPQFQLDCACRKPKTGMIEQAVADFAKRGIQIDVKNSFVIGDKTDDGQMGNNAGCRSVLVKSAAGKGGRDGNHVCHWDFEADDLYDAACYIQGVI